MRCLRMTVFLGAFFLFFSSTIASAIDVPKWWIGTKGEYEDLVKAAKKEGQLVWWAHPDPSCDRLIVSPFEKQYGIKVVHTEYSTAQIVQRILLEGMVNMHTVDLAMISVHHIPPLEKKGLLKKLPYKERVAVFRDIPEIVSPNSTAHIQWTTPRSLAYNTNTVPKDQVPQTFEDLLNPKWKGKIGVDTDLKEYIILAQEWGLEKTRKYLKKLGEQKPKFHRAQSVVTQMVAAGEAYIAPGIGRPQVYPQLIEKGAPIEWTTLKPFVPLDLMLMGVMSHAQHPNAAELYLYWSLGNPEWQAGVAKCNGYGHAMIPGTPMNKALKGVKIVPFGWDWGVRAAKEGWGEQFRKIIGAE